MENSLFGKFIEILWKIKGKFTLWKIYGKINNLWKIYGRFTLWKIYGNTMENLWKI